jgi:hypothetical protein
MRYFAFVPVSRDVKLAITGPVFCHIGTAVYARAGDVLVVLSIVGGQPARTAHISIAFPVREKTFQKFKDFLLVRIEKIAFRLLEFSQGFIKLLNFIHQLGPPIPLLVHISQRVFQYLQ